MKVQKFNIHWQICRAKAKRIKNLLEKINFVYDFLTQNRNIHNYERVLNWAKTTSYGYKDKHVSNAFVIFGNYLKKHKNKFLLFNDNDNDLSKIKTSDLKLVLNDLNKRKYGFQFNKTPLEHIDFVNNLHKEIKSRKEHK